MIKQQFTEQRRNRIHNSMIRMAVLAKMFQVEHAMELDVKLAKPELNKFAGRIKADAVSIGNHMAAGSNMTLKVIGNEQVDSYAANLYRVFTHFMSLEEKQIEEFMDGITMLQSHA